MAFVLCWLLFSIAVGVGASRRYSRSGIDWFMLAIIVSPLIAGAFLLAVGPKPIPIRRGTVTRAGKYVTPPPIPADDLDAAIRSLRAS